MNNGNPFEKGSWSYKFWEDGFNSQPSDENPYVWKSFPWEIWIRGRHEKTKRLNHARGLANLPPYSEDYHNE